MQKFKCVELMLKNEKKDQVRRVDKMAVNICKEM